MRNKFVVIPLLFVSYFMCGLTAAQGVSELKSRKSELLELAKSFLADESGLSYSEFTKLHHQIDTNIEGNKVTTRKTLVWYYPNKADIQELGYDSIYFNAAADKVRYVNAVATNGSGESWVDTQDIKTIDSDTYNVFTDGKKLIVNYVGLEQGSISAIEYEIERDLTKLEGSWSAIYYPQSSTLSKSFQLTVTSAADKPLYVHSSSEFAVCENTQVSVSCKAKDIPPAESDEDFYWRDVLGQIVVSEVDNWEQLKRSTAQRFDQARKKNSLVKSTVDSLMSPDMSEDEMITAIHEFVARDIRYVSMSESGYAITPHSPDETITKRYGDCKDKSVVLLELLSEIGLKPYPVLVATNRMDALRVNQASLNYFDHVVVCFDLNGTESCMDATDSTTDWRYTSDWVQGKVSLPILAKSRPGILPMANFLWKLEQNTEIEVDDLGGQIENQKVSFVGAYASRVRSILEGESEMNQTKWVEELYSDIVSEGSVPDVSISGVSDLDKNIEITTKTVYEPYFEPEAEISLVEYDAWIQNELNRLELENSVYSELFRGAHVVSSYQFTIPKRWKLESLPADLKLETQYGSLVRETKVVADNIIQVNSTLLMPAKSVELEQIAEFNKTLDVFKSESVIRYTASEAD